MARSTLFLRHGARAPLPVLSLDQPFPALIELVWYPFTNAAASLGCWCAANLDVIVCGAGGLCGMCQCNVRAPVQAQTL